MLALALKAAPHVQAAYGLLVVEAVHLPGGATLTPLPEPEEPRKVHAYQSLQRALAERRRASVPTQGLEPWSSVALHLLSTCFSDSD